MTDAAHTPSRRVGADTRREIQRVALDLFTVHGYEATSLRQIADELGINKASLYYYFDSKEGLLRSLFEQRGEEVQQLLQWLHEQPASPDLLRRTVLRWVDSFSSDKLRGIRFVAANPLISHAANRSSGEQISSGLQQLADELAPLLRSDTPQSRLLLRMAILSINAAVVAAAGSGSTDEQVVQTAHEAATALLRDL